MISKVPYSCLSLTKMIIWVTDMLSIIKTAKWGYSSQFRKNGGAGIGDFGASCREVQLHPGDAMAFVRVL